MDRNVIKNKISALKEWLREYYEEGREIKLQLERLEYLEKKLSNATSPLFTDMPRGGSSNHDKFADYICKKEEIEEKIKSAMESRKEREKEIEDAVCQLRNPNERAVIRMRYLDHNKWEEVAEQLFGSREDFDEHFDSQLRRVYMIHGKALMHMAEIIKI